MANTIIVRLGNKSPKEKIIIIKKDEYKPEDINTTGNASIPSARA